MIEPERPVLRGPRLERIELGVPGERPARHGSGDRTAVAPRRKEETVARVVDQLQGERAFRPDAFLLADQLRRVARHVVDIDLFQPVGQVDALVRPDRATQRDAAARVALVVLGTEIPALVLEEVETQRQAAVQEPRLDERDFIIRPLRSELRSQLQLLAGSHEPRPAQEVEIALRQLHETDQGIHAGEAGADHELAGLPLLDLEREIELVRLRRAFRDAVHVFEVTQVAQPAFADAHLDFAEYAGRMHRELAPDHLVLRDRVAADVDIPDIGEPTFGHGERHIGRRILAVDIQVVPDAGPDVPPVAIVIPHGLRSLLDGRQRGHVAGFHRDHLRDGGRIESGYTGQRDAADVVLPLFLHGDLDAHALRARQQDIGRAHLHVEVSLVEIRFADHFHVRLEIVGIVRSRAGDPGQPVDFLLGHGLLQLARRNVLVALEAYFPDPGPLGLIHAHADDHHAGIARRLDLPGDVGLGIVLLLVLLAHLLGLDRHRRVVHHVADAQLEPLPDLAVAHLLRPADLEPADAGLALDHEDHVHAAGNRFDLDIHARVPAALLQRPHIPADRRTAEGIAGLAAGEGQDTLLIHDAVADHADPHLADIHTEADAHEKEPAHKTPCRRTHPHVAPPSPADANPASRSTPRVRFSNRVSSSSKLSSTMPVRPLRCLATSR
ncbi:MAG: hypothetical protein BWY59_00756 [Verrucomicrobia bacterium ADurb.Bin345]|nr:MAG: hypothetical protein BWY59_00756 [Verrucomicrobia bacterium ADurb.Bin345]